MENPVRTRELGIQGLKVINDSPWEYIAENEVELSRCNKCNCNSLHFIRPHSRQLIDALNISSKPRIIDLIHQHCHFQCQSAACCKVVEKIIHFAAPKHRMTYRLEKYVYQRCLADKIENVDFAVIDGERPDGMVLYINESGKVISGTMVIGKNVYSYDGEKVKAN